MATKKTDYQSLSRELEEILSKLQAADVDIDEAMNLYERGMAISKELETYLKSAENKITKIKSTWEKT